MKNIYILTILILFISSCSVSQKDNQTADEIWDKYVSNLGDSTKMNNYILVLLNFILIDISREAN